MKNSEEVKAVFILAGIPVLKIKPLVDGYGYKPDDERFLQTLPRCAWWFVKTEFGWIEIGRRKNVYSIDWEDTEIRTTVTTDEVTKWETGVHAWSVEKAIEYLRALKASTKSDAIGVDCLEDSIVRQGQGR